jgi:MEKHLA domain
MDEQASMEASAGARLALLLASYARLAGQMLASDAGSLWQLPLAVLAHDTAPSPRFFYGNGAALALFRMDAAQFVGLESRFSAEPGERAARAAMFARLEAADIVTGYQGVRIAADGTRFAITDAVIWNLRDDAGVLRGQAALLPQWQPL